MKTKIARILTTVGSLATAVVTMSASARVG